MAALHGREDPLLVPARFERFLRQANDAEVADVRKLGDGLYEVLLPRSARLHSQAQARNAPKEAVPVDVTGELPLPPVPPAEPAAATAGRSATLRFRRGSRAMLRPAEIPLVGVVAMHAPEPEAVAPAPEKTEAKPARPRKRGGAKPKGAAKPPAEAAVAAVGAEGAADAAPPRRRGRGPRKR
jgi:hypothetical protein